MRAIDTPCAWAIGCIASITAKPRVSSTGGKSKPARRPWPSCGLSRPYLPDSQPPGDPERFHDLPGRPIGDADVADMALLDERVERAQRFLDRRRRIEAVD